MKGGRHNLCGQAIIEYSLMLSVAVAAILGMQLYAKRGVQGGVKAVADALSPHAGDVSGEQAQRDGIAYESGERHQQSVAIAGTILDRRSKVHSTSTQTINTQERAGIEVARTTVTDTAATVGVLNQDDPTLPAGTSTHSEVVVSNPQ